jgi:hypothetical protein
VALELCRAVDDPAISDADYRMKARQLLASWGQTASRARTSRAAKVRERLTEDWRRLRASLKIVIPLDVCGEENDDVVHALKNLEDCYPNQWTDLWKDAHVPSGRAWRTLIESPDREQAFRAYEAAMLWGLRRGLRNGSLWLPEAQRYEIRPEHRVTIKDDPRYVWERSDADATRTRTAGFTVVERSSMARGIPTRHYDVFAIADTSYGITETHGYVTCM